MTTTPSLPTRWPPGRILVAFLFFTFVGLVFELRVEHVDVVREDYLAWTPIAYSCLMSVICLVSLIFWRRVTRLILLPLFFLSIVVGGLGFYLHNRHRFEHIYEDTVNSWTDPTMAFPKESPPHTAPLSYAALGVLGTLATLKRFN